MNRPPSERMALAFSEDAMAIASWADAHGFSEDAGALNRFAAKVRPPMPKRLCGREQRRSGVGA